MDNTLRLNNKYSQESLLIRVGLLMYMVILVQALKLFFIDADNWHHHFFNILFHGVCLLLSMQNLKVYPSRWSKFTIFICFASYLIVACHLWQSDPAISYFILLELFVASMVFPNRENVGFVVLVVLLMLIYFYLQYAFSSLDLPNQPTLYHVEKLNHITLAFASVACAVYLRFMITVNWKRVKHVNEQNISVIDTLVPKRFQHNLLVDKPCASNQPFDIDECAIISIDIVNSTQLMRTIGDFKAQQAFNRIFQRIDQLVVDSRAFRIKTNGDQYLLAVGYSDTRHDVQYNLEQCAYHAIALAINASQLIQHTSKRHILSVRIGIASGRVYSGLSSYVNPVHDIWGETVVRCTRLERIADANELVIDKRTFNALKRELSFAFVQQEVSLRGLGEHTIYRAKSDALARVIASLHTE